MAWRQKIAIPVVSFPEPKRPVLSSLRPTPGSVGAEKKESASCRQLSAEVHQGVRAGAVHIACEEGSRKTKLGLVRAWCAWLTSSHIELWFCIQTRGEARGVA